MAVLFTQNDYQLRIYDGQTTPNPDYINVTFYEFHTLPGKVPRPDTTVIAGGGRLDEGNVASYVADETPIMNPLPFSFAFFLDPDKLWQLDALGNPRDLTTWNVGTTPTVWVPTPVASIGSRRNTRGAAITCPGPADADQIAFLFAMEIKDVAPSGAPTGDDYVARYNGCVTTDFTHEVQQGPTRVTISGLIFGEIDLTPADFTTGTETT